MPTPRIDYADQLRDEITSMLVNAGISKVTVTLDPIDIPSGSRHGVIVISPPDLAFPTFAHTDADYELAVVAGPADNLLAAWRRLDEILDALQAGQLDMQHARGDMFAPKAGPQLPGYTITLNPITIESEIPL